MNIYNFRCKLRFLSFYLLILMKIYRNHNPYIEYFYLNLDNFMV